MMADKAYDAVIVGGGNKGLLLAMYLVKYGGMSVGVFERRHEIGGCCATEELSAPGFLGNTHANMILPWYFLPVLRDFPEFWDYGAQWEQHLSSAGMAFRDKENCLALYSHKHDPDQERSAREIARFSERDAETWLKMTELEKSDELMRTQMDTIFNPAEMRAADPGILRRQAEVYAKILELGFNPDSLILKASAHRVIREWFESPELQSSILRTIVSFAVDVNEPGHGGTALGMMLTVPMIGFNRGGTHRIAHAAHQVLTQLGCEFHITKEVEKAIIENGRVTGIRLADGTEVAARRLVVSTLSPHQLIFDLIGREHVDDLTARRVELLKRNFGCLMWYTLAVHEAPQYRAEAFNPDVHDCGWLGMQPDPDPAHVSRKCQYAQMNMWPPLEDYGVVVGSHSLVDSSYAPAGKHAVYTEQLGQPVSMYSEAEWLELRKKYTDELMSVWEDYAPNMTWDNVIGVDMNSPYDHMRMKNLGPDGTWAGVDRAAWQVDENRPTPELANHRTPVENLYATGGSWYVGSNCGSSESYNCYKIIANDLGLSKPWEEPGKEEPDSLVEGLRSLRERVRDSAGK
jgi:beta-carotene ketolase (CrtO type)